MISFKIVLSRMKIRGKFLNYLMICTKLFVASNHHFNSSKVKGVLINYHVLPNKNFISWLSPKKMADRVGFIGRVCGGSRPRDHKKASLVETPVLVSKQCAFTLSFFLLLHFAF
jgi:hypothetical protein